MKNTIRLALVVMMFSLLVPAIGHAQEASTDQQLGSAVSSGVYLQTAQSGMFADNGDGTYMLTLEGVPETMTWAMILPVMSLKTVNTGTILLYWEANGDVSTPAALQVGDVNVRMTLDAPTYDAAGTATFQVQVEAIQDPQNSKDPTLPMSFDASTLSIAWSPDFQAGLFGETASEPETGVRAPSQECQAAKQAERDLEAQVKQLTRAVNSANQACLAGDQAACDSYNTLYAEWQSLYQQWIDAQALVSTTC
jgi:hypothetical protein